MEEGARRAATGLVIGKFLPPHRGHRLLLDFARAYVDRLTVLVLTRACEPIPGALRHGWVRELCPGAEVLHVPAENPQEPHEHPRFWEIWTETIRAARPGPIDVVFTSEDYGDELARRLGARHVCVDRARDLVPVSGTAIRAAPLRHWEHIPACVRPHFVRRVCVYGPESTGKTTLATRLASHFATAWVPEYARGYLDRKGAWVEPSDLAPIAHGQAALEDALARRANRVLVCDSDLLTTAVYADILFGAIPPWLQAAADARRYDLHLLCAPDVPWVADRQRFEPRRREEHFERFRAALGGRPHVVVRGGWEERFEIARRAVEAVLAEPAAG